MSFGYTTKNDQIVSVEFWLNDTGRVTLNVETIDASMWKYALDAIKKKSTFTLVTNVYTLAVGVKSVTLTVGRQTISVPLSRGSELINFVLRAVM